MKRLLSLLLAGVFCLLSASAMAEPRYPAAQGPVTDAAAVLSATTVQDLRELAERLDDADTLELYVVTVDFLDGETISAYGEGLREKWGLRKGDLLLLMAVGEDKFGFFGAQDVEKRLPASVQQKLLSTSFEALFLAQDYDGAIAALMPALAREAAKAWNEEVDAAGLFGTAAASALNTEQDWLVRPVERVETTVRNISRLTEEDVNTGFSVGKIILTVFLLSIIFGNRKGKRQDRGCGCGCMPFSSLLAGWGLWKLWKK